MALLKTIICVGSGKGGVGKSLICTNLAVALALGGQKVVLVDVDYGSSNLHALLGITNPKYGFLDLLKLDEEKADSLLLDTGIANLKFLSGAGDLTGSANIDSNQRQKILEHIRTLDANVILLDLGPGTHYNNVEFFNLGDKGIILSSPEMTSVMNAFSFIRAALFQRLEKEFQDQREVLKWVEHSKPPEPGNETYSIDQLKKNLETVSPEANNKLERTLNAFKPTLIVNRVRKKKDILAGDNLVYLTQKYLDVELNYLGYIIESDRIRNSVEEMVPFLIKDPQSKPSENLQQIIRKLTDTDVHLQKKDGVIFVSKQVPLSSGWNY